MKKKHTTFYITSELKELIDYLLEREEIPKTLYLKRAIRHYLNGDRKIDPRILITQRTHPDYIRRDTLDSGYIDWSQWEELEQIAKEKKCKTAPIIFQALIEYSAELLSAYCDEITIREK